MMCNIIKEIDHIFAAFLPLCNGRGSFLLIFVRFTVNSLRFEFEFSFCGVLLLIATIKYGRQLSTILCYLAICVVLPRRNL